MELDIDVLKQRGAAALEVGHELPVGTGNAVEPDLESFFGRSARAAVRSTEDLAVQFRILVDPIHDVGPRTDQVLRLGAQGTGKGGMLEAVADVAAQDQPVVRARGELADGEQVLAVADKLSG